MTTPRAIFPGRKIGRLADGYEASFLVLDGDPLADWSRAHKIVSRVKQGHSITPGDAKLPPVGL
jgi:imidazolonepropionase-like amidohydrolase